MFKITADREAFAQLIGRASVAAERRATNRIETTGALLEAKDGTLTVTTTDASQQLSLILTETVEVAEAGKILVPAQILAQYAQRMPGEKITLEADGGTVKISGGGPEFALRLLNADNYPEVKTPSGDGIEISGDVFFGALTRALPSVGTDSSRPALAGILIEVADGTTHVVSTDSYRLSVGRVESGLGPDGSVIIPATGGMVTKIEKALGRGELTLRLEENSLSLQTEKGTAVVRLIEGQYPNWRSLLSGERPYKASFEIAAFKDAMSRIELMSGRVVPVTLEFTPEGILNLGIEHSEIGHGHEKVVCEFTGEEPFKVKLNIEYMMAGINTLGTTKAVFELADPHKAIQVRGDDGNGYIYVVMPVRS